MRETTGRVAGTIGEFVGAVQAIQVAGAEERAVEHFDALGEDRRHAFLAETRFAMILQSVSPVALTFGTGLVLLSGAHLMRAGSFTVGDFALFTIYVSGFPVSMFPGWFGELLVDFKRARVSLDRMFGLLPEGAQGALFERGNVSAAESDDASPAAPHAERGELARLELVGVTYRHPGGSVGIEGVNLTLERGSFTVVTGRIGSGKTTLIETLLGLVPAASGEVRWNGETVADPRTFLVPPRCAYTPQVPRLFSDTLRDNIMMGLPDDGGGCWRRFVLPCWSLTLRRWTMDWTRLSDHGRREDVRAQAGPARIRRHLQRPGRGDRTDVVGARIRDSKRNEPDGVPSQGCVPKSGLHRRDEGGPSRCRGLAGRAARQQRGDAPTVDRRRGGGWRDQPRRCGWSGGIAMSVRY